MKRIAAIVIVFMVILSSFALADGKVTIKEVGDETKHLKYKIVDSGIIKFNDIIGLKTFFVYVAIKNNGSKYIAIDDYHIELEDNKGRYICSADDYGIYIKTGKKIIAPHDIGYIYGAEPFKSSDDTSHGVNATVQLSLLETNRKIRKFKPTEVKLKYNQGIPLITGKVKNTTKQDIGRINVLCVLKDKNKKIIWIDNAVLDDVYAGTSKGFEIYMVGVHPDVKKGNIKYYKVYAYDLI